MSLEGELQRLNHRFMSICDYAHALKSDTLPKWPEGFQDNSNVRYPHKHPLNSYNVARRLSAARTIIKFARDQPKQFTPDVLERIYVHMFDCSPVVRHSLVSALYYVGDKSAIQDLNRLFEIETAGEFASAGSELVKNVAEIVMQKIIRGPASAQNTMLVISPDIDFVIALREFCADNQLHIWIGDQDSSDLLGVPFKVAIVDLEWLNQDTRDGWIEFMRESEVQDSPFVLFVTGDLGEDSRFKSRLMDEFGCESRAVDFVRRGEGDRMFSLVQTYLDVQAENQPEIEKTSETAPKTGRFSSEESQDHRTIVKSKTDITNKNRIHELINRFSVSDPREKIDMQSFAKWRIQVKWFLSSYLGENHPYTVEAKDAFFMETGSGYDAAPVITIKGILEALQEDSERGLV